ncbi:hypothetical protein [Pseudomonas citronellolis]|uniref:hypothetical protein n=1 Tax=Pseudomonas citronellolis TaxID=53408 RepID=UPI0023E43ACD|nr:hypothetical protein [Pseudomonas citronellolis]MDF3935545.1 hypothetical protein [Pseudomonas citronellolis]
MRRLILSLLIPLLAVIAPGAAFASFDTTLQAAQRYLLLYSATGDERFLLRLENLDARFQAQVDAQGNSATLRDVWELYGETVRRVADGYISSGRALREALAQALEVSALLQELRIDTPAAGGAAGLADNLQRLALLQARIANRRLLGEEVGGLQERIAGVRDTLEAQFAALPSTPEGEAMRARWRYLRLTERPTGTLLYPFNAQVEHLLERLGDG